MDRRHFSARRLAAFLLSLWLIAPAPAGAEPIFSDQFAGTRTLNGCPAIDQDAIERELIAAVNRTRVANGVLPLSADSRLGRAARLHADDMAVRDYFSHKSPEGTRVSTRATRAGYPWLSIGENIARGQLDVDAVMTAWLNSDGHRRNMLRAPYCDIGVGVSRAGASGCALFWTQVFGSTASCSR